MLKVIIYKFFYIFIIIDGRVNSNLNLSRAFGDLEYKKNSSLTPKE